jgi:hypothetical protein
LSPWISGSSRFEKSQSQLSISSLTSQGTGFTKTEDSSFLRMGSLRRAVRDGMRLFAARSTSLDRCGIGKSITDSALNIRVRDALLERATTVPRHDLDRMRSWSDDRRLMPPPLKSSNR